MVLAAISFAYLKVNGTKERMLTDILEFSTTKLCKNKREKSFALNSNVEQSSMFSKKAAMLDSQIETYICHVQI